MPSYKITYRFSTVRSCYVIADNFEEAKEKWHEADYIGDVENSDYASESQWISTRLEDD